RSTLPPANAPSAALVRNTVPNPSSPETWQPASTISSPLRPPACRSSASIVRPVGTPVPSARSAFVLCAEAHSCRSWRRKPAQAAAPVFPSVPSARSRPCRSSRSPPMSEARRHHISSAVIATRPGGINDVIAALATFDNVEVHGADKGKIVIVIEGPSTGVLGDTLMRISVLDGVIAANMVFEHVEMEEDEVDGQRTDAA